MNDNLTIRKIIEFTIPGSDDGVEFVNLERLNLVMNTLVNSNYGILGDKPLSKIFQHKNFNTKNPFILISCHIDSCYYEYFAELKGNELIGTFDNSACNGILIQTMLSNLLHDQVLISFTGDEEVGFKGVDQTIECLKEKQLYENLEMVITLDLTEEFYGMNNYSIENYFVESTHRNSKLRFVKKKNLKQYLKIKLADSVFIKNAEPDESWQYDEYNLNCFSLCLPCKVLGRDMHDDKGITILSKSVNEYFETLIHLSNNICEDLILS